jgi:hypothetical protein
MLDVRGVDRTRRRKAQMEAVVKKLSMAVTVLLIIDTTEADVAECCGPAQ